MAHDEALGRLNAMPAAEAIAVFRQCCASTEWAAALAAVRPFAVAGEMFDAADRIWNGLGEAAWREAFDGHPRIGEKKAAAAVTATQQRWSEGEQAQASIGDDDVRAQLAAAQREYEERFGHIFLICATGRSSADILASLRARLSNDADTELRVAAEEQRKITRLRLEKLLSL